MRAGKSGEKVIEMFFNLLIPALHDISGLLFCAQFIEKRLL